MEYSERRKYYHIIRQRCYAEVIGSSVWIEKLATLKGRICLEIAHPSNVREAHEWKTEPKLNWNGILETANDKEPRHFDVAVFVDGKLGALAHGRVSKGKRIVRIDRIARNPSCDELKRLVVPLVVDIAMTYAQKLGAKSLKITEPMDKLVSTLIDVYNGSHELGWNSFPYEHVSIPVVS
ncbi:MAG: hypothetical protein CMI08_17830 [Oceanospirillaceae bacterium]|uniref:hypothetical protein n=1 Tax=unclassified Thalassolituus TaxID=2624967 RepID=UPI000C0BAE40|nr:MULTISPECIES: hypothetical protein [unclassified Thalassolituus]MAK92841.1 hypothetical protein [Thalassolituus sp.]MAS24952.1 hypothetical protein [Oceanospirillaceae bacterium]MAY01026.1 hypothetical protein [Oceanospirillaceae bacterium]MBS53410.1 hypothetical protein [Oceanospirillaceae bacterium]|tara:strand:- start:66 stop:605 length:540 start_codon:yes stop_codon:yes gene_type:complete